MFSKSTYKNVASCAAKGVEGCGLAKNISKRCTLKKPVSRIFVRYHISTVETK